MDVKDMRSVYMLEQVWQDGTTKPIMVSDQADPIDKRLEDITEETQEFFGSAEQVYAGWNTREGYSLIQVYYGPGVGESKIRRRLEYRVWILDFTPDE